MADVAHRARWASLAALAAAWAFVASSAFAEESASEAIAGAKLSGSGYYKITGVDGPGGDPKSWKTAQEASLSLDLRSKTGLDVYGDATVPIEAGPDPSPEGAVRQLYVRLSPLDSLTIIAGKQRLNWGCAKVFSAIDTLESRADPLDEGSELSGVGGIKAVYIPTDWLSLSAVVLPGDEPRWTRGALRADFVADAAGLDLGLGAVKLDYTERSGPPAVSGTKVDRLAFISDSAWTSGNLVLYQESQLRWGRESGYCFPGMSGFEDLGGSSSAVFRLDAGAMLQVDLGLKRPTTLIAEYLYNGDGLAEAEAESFSERWAAWMSAGAPDGAFVPEAFSGIGGLRRHYLAGIVKDVAIDRYLLAGASGIIGLDGGFSRIELSIEWLATQNQSFRLTYERFGSFDDAKVSEERFLAFRDRVAATFSASY